MRNLTVSAADLRREWEVSPEPILWKWMAERLLTARQNPKPEDVEALAWLVFDSRGFWLGEQKPAWVNDGNSIRQEEARDIARSIIAHYGTPPAAPALTPQQQAVLDAAQAWQDAHYGDNSLELWGHFENVLQNLPKTVVDPVTIGMAVFDGPYLGKGTRQNVEFAIRAALDADRAARSVSIDQPEKPQC